MATANDYAQWIVNNQDKKGTPEFDTVAKAYQASKNIDIETGKPMDIEIPTAKVLARRKIEKPFETGADISGKLLDLWEASKLEGLMPEVNPLSGATKQPFFTTRATEIAGDINAFSKTQAAKKMGDVLSKLGEGASYVGGKIAGLPNKLLAWESQRDPLAFSTLYNAAKEGNPEALAAIQEATPLGKKLHSDAVYNYTRSMFNAPHEIAITAEDFTRGTNPRGLGAWDVGADRAYAEFPNLPAAEARARSSAYKPWNELSDAEKIKQATQAGVDTSVWTPLPPKTGSNDLGNAAFTLAKKAILPSVMHVTAPLSSPRIARMAAMLAGKGANLVGQVGEAGKSAYEMLPEASIEDLINAGIIVPKTRNQGE